MSKEAQAERERRARVILGTAETEIAEKFELASRKYTDNPVALHLRGMNMLFEGLKEKGSMVVVPSSALDSMNLGAMGGLVSLAKATRRLHTNDICLKNSDYASLPFILVLCCCLLASCSSIGSGFPLEETLTQELMPLQGITNPMLVEIKSPFLILKIGRCMIVYFIYMILPAMN